MKKRVQLFLSLVVGVNILTGCSNIKLSESKVVNSEGADSTMELINVDAQELKGEISISTFYEHEYLEQGAKAFEQKYPGTSIKINHFTTAMPEVKVGEEGFEAGGDPDPNHTIENYLTYLNTAFMSGKVEDMILIDFLPLYKYIESGYLMELTPMIENDYELNDENYYMNVIEAMKYNNKIYSIPMSYSIPFVNVDAEVFEEAGLESSMLENDIWNVTLMKELLEQVSIKSHNKVYIEQGDGQYIFSTLMKSEGNRFINLETKEINFGTEDFISLLEQCKKLEDEGDLAESDSKNILFSIYDSGGEHNAFLQDYYTYPGYKEKRIASKPLVGNQGNLQISASQSYVISNSSSNKSLCWAFMKFMMSEEMQRSANLFDFSINKKAEASRCQYLVNDWVKKLTEQGAVFNVTEEKIFEDYQHNMNKWSSRINTCNMLTDELEQTIYEEISPFFKGKKTAEDAAKSLQNKFYVMLNE